jgi:Ser/Thr protein kinase RdoA (MazF antagonist)
MRPFEALTYRGRIRRLRRLAIKALQAYGLDSARLRALTNSENMTFRVDGPVGQRYVLRIHQPGRNTTEEIACELAWLAALRRETDLGVPDPVIAQNGSFVVLADADGVPGPRPCVLFRWLDGVFMGDRLGVAELRKVGAFMARLHNHASRIGCACSCPRPCGRCVTI